MWKIWPSSFGMQKYWKRIKNPRGYLGHKEENCFLLNNGTLKKICSRCGGKGHDFDTCHTVMCEHCKFVLENGQFMGHTTFIHVSFVIDWDIEKINVFEMEENEQEKDKKELSYKKCSSKKYQDIEKKETENNKINENNTELLFTIKKINKKREQLGDFNSSIDDSSIISKEEDNISSGYTTTSWADEADWEDQIDGFIKKLNKKEQLEIIQRIQQEIEQ